MNMGELTFAKLDRETLGHWLPALRGADGDLDWMEWPDEAYFMSLPAKWELSRAVFSGDRLVGYALCSAKGPTAWLHRIAITADCRASGVGATLMREVERVSRSKGFRKLGLKSPVNNKGAISFYERNGFAITAIADGHVNFLKDIQGRVVGIHQPNFAPWLGYFYKMARSDTFVILDDVLAPSRGYFNRTKVLVQGKGHWLTIPVHRGDGRIDRMHPSGEEWASKHLKTLQHTYKGTPYFDQIMPDIEGVLQASAGHSLVHINLRLIEVVASKLQIQSTVVTASEFALQSTGDRRLVELVKAVGGSAYLSGNGGDNYQHVSTFDEAGIELLYTGFESVSYPQASGDEFVPGLSALDALFNIGPRAVRELLDQAPAPIPAGNVA